MKLLGKDIEEQIVTIYTTPDETGAWVGNKTISKIFHISPTTVHNVLKRHGIALRNAKESHAHGKRCKPIKNKPDGSAPFCKCQCGQSVSWNQRKNNWNVYVSGHYRRDALYKNLDWLKEQYEINHRSVNDIAAQFGVNPATIKRRIKKLGINSRTQSESLALSGAVRGDRNPSWKGGIAKWDYAHNWKRIARTIRKRDAYTCQVCKIQFPKSIKLLHVHHKDGNKFHNENTNLITVCATCHPKGKRKETDLL